MSYGDNWIAINAKKKVLHEQYLRILMENHDKIVDDIATHFGTKYPHISEIEIGKGFSKEESIKDLKAKLNASAPEGGHKDHFSAMQSISPHLQDNYLLRTELEEKHLTDEPVDPDDYPDVDLSDHYPDHFRDVADELSKKK